ncbi:MAG: hypothetical protein Q8P84_06930 [Deltaproteobacteria bacterium]|nr:hypothetical protein [Deltaproteobacteria bacterium]
MKSPRRIAIVDRSVLAHNVYQLLLKPLGYSLLPFNDIKSLKSVLTPRSGLKVLLINSNVFGKNFESGLEWLKKEGVLKNLEKLFLCQAGEKKIAGELRKLPRSRVVLKPFHPRQLEEALKKIC